MSRTIRLLNAKRESVGTLMLNEKVGISIEVKPEYSYLEENMRQLGKEIFEQDCLPIKVARKEGVEIISAQEMVGKTDDRYAQAVVEYINKSHIVTPRVFAVCEYNKEVE